MRRWVLVVLAVTLLMAACGDGPDSGGEDGGEQSSGSSTPAGDFDPDAMAIFVARGSDVVRLEPANDNVSDLIGGLVDCYETWYLDGSVWIGCSGGRLLRIDPQSGDIQLDVETGDFVEEIAVEEGSVWVLNGQVGIATEINQIDLESGEIVATVIPEEGSFFEDISVGAGAVWAVGGSAETISTVARIDPATATVTTLIDTAMGPQRVEVGYGSVWAVGRGFINQDGSGGGTHLVGIAPDNNEVVSDLVVGEIDGYSDLALGYDSIWITDTPAGELVRVDNTGSEVEARVGIGAGGQDLFEIDVAKGLVWAGNPFDGEIHGIDPTTNEFETGISGGTKGIAFAP